MWDGMKVGGSKREKHGKDMDLWIAVNCPGLRIPEFLSLGSGMVWVCFDWEMIVKLCLSFEETSHSNSSTNGNH